MASPTPRPPALKLIGGRAPGRDSGGRKVAEAPGFHRIPPAAPEWLPEEAAAEWARVVPELSRLGLLKEGDRAALTAYCLAWDRLVAAQGLLAAAGGMLYEGKQGLTRHPAVAIVEAASKELRGWSAEFGLSPSAAQRVCGNADDDDAGNPFA